MARRIVPIALALLASPLGGCFIGIDDSRVAAVAPPLGGGPEGGIIANGDAGLDDALGGGNGVSADSASGDPTLLGYWAFEDSGNTARDGSGHGNDAVLIGASTRAPGVRGSALRLGAADGMSVAQLDGPNFPKEGTLSFWLRFGGTISGGGGQYGVFDVPEQGRSHLSLRQVPNGGTALELQAETNAGSAAVGSMRLDANVWVHVVVVWSSASQTITAYHGDFGHAVQGNPTDALIRVWSPGQQRVRFGTAYTGDLDEVRLYSRALDAAEVAALP